MLNFLIPHKSIQTIHFTRGTGNQALPECPLVKIKFVKKKKQHTNPFNTPNTHMADSTNLLTTSLCKVWFSVKMKYHRNMTIWLVPTIDVFLVLCEKFGSLILIIVDLLDIQIHIPPLPHLPSHCHLLPIKRKRIIPKMQNTKNYIYTSRNPFPTGELFLP